MTHPTTDRLYDALGPAITGQDPSGLLAPWLDGPGHLLGEVDDVVRDTDSGLGWSREFDPALAKHPRWTAQLLGVQVPDGVSEQTIRDLIVARPSFRRGTPGALRAAAQALLTGTKRVDLFERDGTAYRLRVRTYTAETPDPAAVERALREVKPAGLALTYEVFTGAPYDERDAAFATYDELDASATTYDTLDGSV